MKGCRFYAFLIVVTTFLLLTSAWAETANQEQSKEIFIGQFKGGISAKWCGNNALVVSGREIGMEWIDFLSSNAVKIRPSGYGYDYPYNCTPDGNWLVYVDRKSSRTDKGYKPTKDMNDVDWDGWDGGVVDLYRYDIATGKSQRFAVVRYVGPFEAVSPDGKKIFLGSKHNSAIEMPEPKWDAVWFKNNWGQNGAKWFLDSSGVITRQHNPNRIGVEFFSKNGWAKMFNTQFGDSISILGVDKVNKFYIKEGVRAHYRCNIKNKDLSCEKILESHRDIISFKVLPDGGIVFIQGGDDCIRYLNPLQNDDKCIAEKGEAHHVDLRGISPDGKWLAFVREKKRSKGVSLEKESSLYILKLSNQ